MILCFLSGKPAVRTTKKAVGKMDVKFLVLCNVVAQAYYDSFVPSLDLAFSLQMV